MTGGNGDRSIVLSGDNTRVTFAVRWLGVLTVRGRFTDVEGVLRIPDGCVEDSELAVGVSAASVRTGIHLRDRHLRGPRFLDAATHPRITLQSLRIERPNGLLIMTARLVLRGLERDVQVMVPLAYADGSGMQSMVRMYAELTVSRVPHGIGVASGLHRFNPLLRLIGRQVRIRAEVLVPAGQLLPALLPALGG
jgi:polyisoprenoid-binding protein YceI